MRIHFSILFCLGPNQALLKGYRGFSWICTQVSLYNYPNHVRLCPLPGPFLDGRSDSPYSLYLLRPAWLPSEREPRMDASTESTKKSTKIFISKQDSKPRDNSSGSVQSQEFDPQHGRLSTIEYIEFWAH